MERRAAEGEAHRRVRAGLGAVAVGVHRPFEIAEDDVAGLEQPDDLRAQHIRRIGAGRNARIQDRRRIVAAHHDVADADHAIGARGPGSRRIRRRHRGRGLRQHHPGHRNRPGGRRRGRFAGEDDSPVDLGRGRQRAHPDRIGSRERRTRAEQQRRQASETHRQIPPSRANRVRNPPRHIRESAMFRLRIPANAPWREWAFVPPSARFAALPLRAGNKHAKAATDRGEGRNYFSDHDVDRVAAPIEFRHRRPASRTRLEQ